jgi:hypothetical protein
VAFRAQAQRLEGELDTLRAGDLRFATYGSRLVLHDRHPPVFANLHGVATTDHAQFIRVHFNRSEALQA